MPVQRGNYEVTVGRKGRRRVMEGSLSKSSARQSVRAFKKWGHYNPRIRKAKKKRKRKKRR